MESLLKLLRKLNAVSTIIMTMVVMEPCFQRPFSRPRGIQRESVVRVDHFPIESKIDLLMEQVVYPIFSYVDLFYMWKYCGIYDQVRLKLYARKHPSN